MENNYQLSRIHNYLNGLMAEEDMHALEREALHDPFLRDAIDGYALEQGVDAKSLSLLQRRLERRIATDAARKNSHYFGWQRLSVGLLAGVLFITVSILFLIRYIPSKPAQRVTEVELMDDQLALIMMKPLPKSDAQPVGGWATLERLLASHQWEAQQSGSIQVSFKINAEGKPHLLAGSKGTSAAFLAELTKVLADGPKWKGKAGALEISFP